MRRRVSRTNRKPAPSGAPVTSVEVEAGEADAIEIAHRGCLLCVGGTDHVLSAARSRTT